MHLQQKYSRRWIIVELYILCIKFSTLGIYLFFKFNMQMTLIHLMLKNSRIQK